MSDRADFIANIVILCVALAAGSIMMCVAGCDTYTPPTASEIEQNMTEVTNYGNGIYYIPYRGRYFGDVLSAWRKKNPELRIVSVAIDPDIGRDNAARGYFIITESVK